MRKFKVFLIATVFSLIASISFAAGTIQVTDLIYPGDRIRKMTFTVVFGADASAPANTAIKDVYGYNKDRPLYNGWWIFRVDINPGATGPTDNTDLYLWSVEDKNDILGANGENAVDSATSSSVYPATSTQPLTGDELIDFDNNAVNNASTTVIFTLYKD